jgi:hypothetical protein
MPNKHSGKVRNAYGAAAYYRRVLAIYPDALLAWQLSEAAGRTATEITGKTAAALDLLDNGGFETAGAGGAGVGDQDWVNATYTVDDSNCVLAGGSLTAQE